MMEKNLKFSLEEEEDTNCVTSYEEILNNVEEESKICKNPVDNGWAGYGMDDMYMDQFLTYAHTF